MTLKTTPTRLLTVVLLWMLIVCAACVLACLPESGERGPSKPIRTRPPGDVSASR